MTSQNLQLTARLHFARRAALGAVAVFRLTTVHHLYGAYVYKTPWRRHAGIVSGLATAVSVGALAVWRRRPTGVAGTLALWTFTLVTLVIQVAGFGLCRQGWIARTRTIARNRSFAARIISSQTKQEN
jgi:hypothetical protein